jgi:hypothetical protein
VQNWLKKLPKIKELKKKLVEPWNQYVEVEEDYIEK